MQLGVRVGHELRVCGWRDTTRAPRFDEMLTSCRIPLLLRGPVAGIVVGLVSVSVAWAAPSAAQTILNIERLQPGDVELWHWGVEGALSVSEGNTDYVDVLAGVVLGHRWPSDWLRVFAGIDYRSETGEGLEYDRYLHVRHNHWYGSRWQSFHFLQLQASHASLLQRRMLVGSGVRRRLVDTATTFDVGTGAMFEREELDGERVVGDHPIDSRVWRMANLLVATRRLTDAVRLIGVAYVQPDFTDVEDLRALSDLSLLVALSRNVDLALRGEWRYDSRPPTDVGRHDFLLRTGVTVSFR